MNVEVEVNVTLARQTLGTVYSELCLGSANSNFMLWYVSIFSSVKGHDKLSAQAKVLEFLFRLSNQILFLLSKITNYNLSPSAFTSCTDVVPSCALQPLNRERKNFKSPVQEKIRNLRKNFGGGIPLPRMHRCTIDGICTEHNMEMNKIYENV